MSGKLRISRTVVALALLATCGTSPAASAFGRQAPDRYVGRSLTEALRALQTQGLRIVFTSATVPPELRVLIEPRAPAPRQQLDELLAPHNLKALDGPGGVILVVRAEPASTDRPAPAATGTIAGRAVHALTGVPLAGVVVVVDGMAGEVPTDAQGRFVVRHVNHGTRTVRAAAAGFALVTRALHVSRGTTTSVTLILSPALGTHSEHVTVSRPRPYRHDRGVVSEMNLERAQLGPAYGGLVDDPIRAMQAFPHVSVVDDFRSEFSVRGSPTRHVGVIIDGVATPWLQHTAHGRGATGSVTMLSSQLVEAATLSTGAYPHRYGDRLGAQLDLALKEGSRTRFGLRGSVGGTNATVLAEGPLARSGDSARGSWLVAARQSYLEWPTERPESARTAFGFSDGLAKVVFDVRPNHQVSFSAIGGMSNVDGEDSLDSSELGDGTNRTSVANFSWRSTFGSSVVLTQRVYLVKHRFSNKLQSGRDVDLGVDEEFVYRTDVATPLFGGLLETGAYVGRTDAERHLPALSSRDTFAGSAWQGSSYAHFAWAVTPALTVSPGLRVTQSTLLPRPTVTRWLLGEWSFRRGWSLSASAGTSYQLPELHHVHGRAGSAVLRPERATHVDVGIEQRVGASVRWQATLFNREEADILREPDRYPRLVGDVVAYPADPGRYANSLSGWSRGIELLVSRQRASGLSGWAAYAYGKARSTDGERRETFWADFDQRHVLSLFGRYQFPNATGVGATFRAASNFLIPAYVAARKNDLVVAQHRNQVRLPPYARLDARADRTFTTFGRRLTLFVEVINVLDRANVGLAHGSILPSTGAAVGFTDTLFPRRVAAGILLEF